MVFRRKIINFNLQEATKGNKGCSTIDGVVKTLQLLRCCKFFYHYDEPWYAEIMLKFTRLEYEVSRSLRLSEVYAYLPIHLQLEVFYEFVTIEYPIF